MELGQPLGLLGLLALPVLLLLYSLRPRRRTVHLSSISLWQEALGERRRGMGLQRLLRDPSLLLLLLCAAALAFGLADPRWLGAASEPGDAVVVVDVSASMQASDAAGGGAGGPSRFERAKARAGELVDALPEGARMMLVASGQSARLLTAFESSKDVLRSALAGLEHTDEAGRPGAALSLALSLLRHRDGGRIHLVTDGAFDPGELPRDARIRVHRVSVSGDAGGSSDNVAITAFDLRQALGGLERFQAFVSLRNLGDAERSVPVTVALEGETLVRETVTLPPGAERSLVWPFEGRAGGRAVASIEAGDRLAVDDRAYAVVGDEQPLRVMLAGEGSFYLHTALAAMPGVTLDAVAALPGAELARAARTHDVVVLDGVPVPELPPGRYLLLDSLPGSLPAALASGLEVAPAAGPTPDVAARVLDPVIVGRGTSPMVHDLDLRGVRIDSASRVRVVRESTGLQRLFWSEETDLGLAYLGDSVRLVYLGFDVAASSFPLQAAFPLFVRHALEFLSPREDRLGSIGIRAGERFTIRTPPGRQDLVVRLPSGEGLLYAVESGSLAFDATARAGIYRYTLGGVHRHFAVNVGGGESDLRPRAGGRSATGEPGADAGGPVVAEVGPVGEGARVVRSLWSHLALAALLLLALEWSAWIWRGRRA